MIIYFLNLLISAAYCTCYNHQHDQSDRIPTIVTFLESLALTACKYNAKSTRNHNTRNATLQLDRIQPLNITLQPDTTLQLDRIQPLNITLQPDTTLRLDRIQPLDTALQLDRIQLLDTGLERLDRLIQQNTRT